MLYSIIVYCFLLDLFFMFFKHCIGLFCIVLYCILYFYHFVLNKHSAESETLDC